jgi:hypothetical protein
MKSFCVASLVVIALLGSWPAVDARTKDPSKFYITMTGHHTQAAGAATDTMRFSVPVQVSRAILPAGTYRFRFLTPTLVQVTSLDGTRMYGTFTTVPITRNIPPNRGQVKFQNIGAQPLRLIAWYMSGDAAGNQPLYPKVHTSKSETNIASN